MTLRRSRLAVALVVVTTSACPAGPPPAAEPPPPMAEVERVPEGELSVVRLDPAAIEHLGIETTEVKATTAPRARTVAGFVIVPPGRTLAPAAPVSGTLFAGETTLRPGAVVSRGDVLLRLVPLAPVDRDVKAQARRQRASTKARLNLAQAKLDRVTELLADRASSRRAIEEATAELETARAEDDAAKARERAIDRAPLAADVTLPVLAPEDGLVRSVSVAIGQTVAAGAPLFEVVPAASLWVRVPVVPADLDRLDVAGSARVARLGSGPDSGVTVSPVEAPPAADPVMATVDLFYALPPDATFSRPGERVSVSLSENTSERTSSVPRSALVLDFDGGTWVYVCRGDGFLRARVEVSGRVGEEAHLRRGPPPGTCVVSVGAMELLGTEFGVKH